MVMFIVVVVVVAQWNSQGSYNQLWYSISNAYNLALDPTNGIMYVTSTQAGNNIVKIQIVNGVATGSNVWLIYYCSFCYYC